MSRLIVIALLACNLVLIGVRAATPSAPETRTPNPPGLGPDTPRLVLLRERADGQDGSGAQCFSLGPYETVATAQRAREVLENRVPSLALRETESLVELGYWVALPASIDFAAAGAQLKELQLAGLEDLAVVTDKDGEFRVSLGYFLDEANARRRRDAVRDLGHPADTRLQRQVETRYWLDYRLADGEISVEAVLEGAPEPTFNRDIPCA